MRLSDATARALPFALLLLAALGVHFLQPPLAHSFAEIRRREDAYYLPSPETSELMSLGYRAAMADLIFAHVLVSHGLHFQEKRRFEFVANYLDTIVHLDPSFREPYRLADTLITMQPTPPTLEDYRAARRLEARGLEQFPYDQELWLIAGQFLAYIAANYVPPAERDEWRLDGAHKLARSCELIGSNQNVPYHCVTAASLFNEAGKRDVVRGFLERVMAISDDPEIQAIAGGYLGKVLGDAERDRADQRTKRFQALWQRDFTFISRESLTLLGPAFDPARCAGLANANRGNCVASFRTWGERLDQGD
ncbi:MAG: hypothetical protein ACOY0T_10715 [Myxococcota bacterium]